MINHVSRTKVVVSLHWTETAPVFAALQQDPLQSVLEVEGDLEQTTLRNATEALRLEPRRLHAIVGRENARAPVT